MSSSSKPANARKKASSARPKGTDGSVDDAPAKVRQTVYLYPATRKQLRLQAVEEDCDLSTIVERALQAYFA